MQKQIVELAPIYKDIILNNIPRIILITEDVNGDFEALNNQKFFYYQVQQFRLYMENNNLNELKAELFTKEIDF